MKITITKLTTAYKVLGLFMVVLVAASCKKNQIAAQLTVANITDTIPAAGGTVALTFNSNNAWSIDTTGIKWLHLSQTSGGSGDATINLSSPINKTGISRSVLLVINSTNGQSRQVTVLQEPVIFASYNTSPLAPDQTGMSSTAGQLVAKFNLGWNIGNTMEAPGSETGWGNPVITQALIDLVKQSGFTAIRIPCTWNQHSDLKTGKIDPVWLTRVSQVVQYCINDGMYVMLNDHDGWLDCKATAGGKLDTIKAKQKAFWEQIATTMRNFDEHLMFASANEPNADDLPSSTLLENYHQIFINAVRSTGGKNAYRTLIIQAPSTDIGHIDYFTTLPGMPVDQVPNKLIIEIHWYSPVNFCLLTADASWGKEWCYWGKGLHSTDDTARNAPAGSEELAMTNAISSLKTNYVDKNIPILIGEFGATRHNITLKGHPADSILSERSRAHWFKCLAQSAHTNHIPAFLWDAYYDLIDRHKNVVFDQRALDSLRVGAGF